MEPVSKLVIFDHLAKTAGSAIASWASEAYGQQNVVRFGHELHGNVVKSYLNRRIACGHTYFDYGEGLSDKCKYSTIVRNPVDRVISWLYFAMGHDADEMRETKNDCVRFLSGRSDELCPNVRSNITNNYIEHFCRIYGSADDNDSDKLKTSIAAIEKYDVVGLYDNMSSFTAEFIRISGRCNKKIRIRRENTTRNRPKLIDVPCELRKSIEKRNELDIYLYNYAANKLAVAAEKKRYFFLGQLPN